MKPTQKFNVSELTKAAAEKKLMTKTPKPMAPAEDSSSSGKKLEKTKLYNDNGLPPPTGSILGYFF